ncbi:MAG: DUF2586 domain-containing protein [Desulfobacterales bacterium]|nr:DUF2586 domain-containing protein [Desulfobacterales bacterium]
MGDVLEFLVDGTSGLAPGGVEGSAMIAGVCSTGEVGKGYLLGKDSDLGSLLGVGPLVDRLKDIFGTGGQSPVVIAVPVAGLSGGYISPVKQTGTGPDATASGIPAGNADVVVEITTGGQLGTCQAQVSEDGGATFGSAAVVPVNGQIAVGTTGATMTLAAGTHILNDTYEFAVRKAIGPVKKTGTGPDISIAGTVKAAAQIVLGVVTGGGRNDATYQLSMDGGDSFGPVRTVPVDGVVIAGTTGVTITVPDSPDLVAGDMYECELMPPVPSITAVMSALEQPLSLYDIEFVHVVGPSDPVDWAAMGAKANELWNAHRPTYFRAETRLPYDNEDLNDWVAAMVQDRQSYSHRFVVGCCAFGEVSDSTGKRVSRNWAGLQSGRVLSVPVQRATGRVLDGGISQGSLPSDYTEAMQKILESEGYATAKHYAGLNSAYWGDARTMAEDTSDFRYEEVLRVVFKAVRKARIAALKSMYDEAGDLALEGNATGITYLKANIENALNTMVAAVPRELAGFVVEIPESQDVVNNGVAVLIKLVGIPIIREIKLFASYSYAGSAFDPRLKSVA